MSKYYFTILLALCLSVIINAQGIENTNRIYDAQIRTVKLHLEGLPTSQPIVDLNSGSKLLLSFDDMSNEPMEYYYTFYHCDADWNTSDIEPLEYLKTFEEGEIRNFQFSGRTMRPYVHYRLRLPNNEMEWSISGNYMLVVYYYDEYDEKVPVFTRRFLVSDNKYFINTRFRFPRETAKLNTHHEIQATVDINKRRLRIPQQQVRLYVYQNGRWDRSATNLEFNRFQGDEYYYDLPGMISLPAPREFRSLDNRFINSPGGKIAHFERTEDGFLALLQPDYPRDLSPYITRFDLNGQNVVMNAEATTILQQDFDVISQRSGDSTLIQPVQSSRLVNMDTTCLACEYVDILFTLKVPGKYDHDVYVFGELSGWNLDPMFKMEYDPSRQAYFAKIQLKQGFYDYQYALDAPDGIDTQTIEGTWHEGENDYLLLVYDRHDFNRGDRLVGSIMVNSSP